VRRFGIDCGNGILYRGGQWEPGGEYIAKLLVKNVSRKTQKFKYQLPAARFFSMEFPEVITLSPGTSISIDVVFRPIKLEPYDDFIRIVVRTMKAGAMGAPGAFNVPVRARLATLELDMPEGVDLGFCPVEDVENAEKRQFLIRNTGQLPAIFRWTVPPPFTLEPSEAQLEEGETCYVTASLVPENASVFVSNAICHITETGSGGDQEYETSMKLSGIGKFAHIVISEDVLDYGEVLVGSQGTDKLPIVKEFTLTNKALVRATFQLRPLEPDHEDHGSPFAFSVDSGCLEPDETIHIKVKYTPMTAGSFTCDTFEYITPGSNSVQITCKGTAMGPNVVIKKNEAILGTSKTSDTSIQFGDVPCGQTVQRVIFLINDSEQPAHYHFMAEEHGTFTFDHVQGVVPPKLRVPVNIYFSPDDPTNVYRRITCLILHQQALFINVLGTGYAPGTRPCPLLQSHVDAYRVRAAKGMGHLGPTQLEKLFERDGDEQFLRKNLTTTSTLTVAKKEQLPRLTRSGDAAGGRAGIMQEFFQENTGDRLPISLTSNDIDFGGMHNLRGNERRTLTVSNNTKGKVTVRWSVPAGGEGDEEGDHPGQGNFSIAPHEGDVEAGQSRDFRVTFRPSQENFYYNCEVEGLVTFKSNRNFRLVNNRCLVPPWCMTARLTGHTFHPQAEQFLARVKFHVPNQVVYFPPCHCGDDVFQTIMMSNTGDTPVQFQFQPDPDRVFTMKPSSGLVHSNGFQLIAVRFRPKRATRYNTQVHCLLNNALSAVSELRMIGTGSNPAIAFPDLGGDTVYFKPTACGIVARRQVELRNNSRVPCLFRCTIPDKLLGVMHIQPRVGRLRGNESITLTVSFSPRSEREYCNNIEFVTRSIATSSVGPAADGPVLQRLNMKLVGQGLSGAISFFPPSLDFGTTLVKTVESREFQLVNSSDCDLLYELNALEGGELPESALEDADDDDDLGISMGASTADMDSTAMTQRTNKNELAVQLRAMRRQKARGHLLDEHGQLTVADRKQLMIFSEPCAVLPARSRKTIGVTFQPGNAGKFDMTIFCEVVSVDREGRPIRVGPADEEFLNNPFEDPNLPDEMTPDPLTCRVQASASFPTLIFQDTRCRTESTGRLWEKLALTPLNQNLATPLTKAEVLFNVAAHPDASQLPRYDIRFEPAAIGTDSCEVLLQMRNPGHLQVDYNLKYPNECEVELEQWADEGEPTSEQLRLNTVIDHDLFELTPRKGKLGPQEGFVLKITYHYKMVGEHDLPVTLQVAKGKQLVLVLRGSTLEESEPRLTLPSAEYALADMQIGQEFPPEQVVELRNSGNSELEYDVDLGPVQELNADNYGFDIFTFLNPRGVIPANGTTLLRLKHTPLQDREYELPLRIAYQGGYGGATRGNAAMLLRANGYHPRSGPPKPVIQEGGLMTIPRGPPRQQLLFIPEQLACLSVEQLAFGDVPQGSVKTQVVVLRNLHATTALEFEWDPMHPLLQAGTLRFHPRSGRLDVGQHVMCKLTMDAASCPSGQAVIVSDVQCLIDELPPPEVKGPRATSSRGRLAESAAGSNAPPLNPAKAVKNIGTCKHVSVVKRTTASKAPKERPRIPREGELAAEESHSGAAAPASTGGGNGAGRRMSMLQSRKMQKEEVVPTVPPARVFLTVSGRIVEYEEFRFETAPEGGAKGFHVPRVSKQAGGTGGVGRAALGGEAAARGGGGGGGGDGGLDGQLAQRLDRVLPDKGEQKALAAEMFKKMMQELCGGADVREQARELPEQAVTPFFRNFKNFGRKQGAPTLLPLLELFDTTNADPAEEEFEKAEEKRRADVLEDLEVQDLCARVLENTMFNLMQEACHGELNLNVVPRRFVMVD
jgi:hypothetical protein